MCANARTLLCIQRGPARNVPRGQQKQIGLIHFEHRRHVLGNRGVIRQVAGSGTEIYVAARTAASIAAMSIFFCFIIAAIAASDTFLSALVVNSVSHRGKIYQDTP